jgi:tRNA threonylcarbamoyladenosine biosynthesis protein TsaE
MTGQPLNEERFETASAEETIAVGHALAALLQPPLLLILRGELGAGKTMLVKGIAEAIGAADAEEVTSPTFTLVHEYQGTSPAPPGALDNHLAAIKLYHLDLYRLEKESQLAALGIDEMVSPDSLVLIEWGEKFPSLVARADGEISLKHDGGDRRSIVLKLLSPRPKTLSSPRYKDLSS